MPTDLFLQPVVDARGIRSMVGCCISITEAAVTAAAGAVSVAGGHILVRS